MKVRVTTTMEFDIPDGTDLSQAYAGVVIDLFKDPSGFVLGTSWDDINTTIEIDPTPFENKGSHYTDDPRNYGLIS